MSRSKVTKRRKVWVVEDARRDLTASPTRAGVRALAPGLPVPFVELLPGDVALSREEVKRAGELLGRVEALTGWGDGTEAQRAGEELRALLRGRR